MKLKRFSIVLTLLAALFFLAAAITPQTPDAGTPLPPLKSPSGKIYARTHIGPPDNAEPVVIPKVPAGAAPSADNFNGSARKAAKLSIASGTPQSFTDLGAVLDSLPSDEEMRALNINKGPKSGRVAQEKKLVTVTAFLYASSKESDNDFHCIVGLDPSGTPRFMNVEVSALPPASSTSFATLKTARNEFKTFFTSNGDGLPAGGYDKLRPADSNHGNGLPILRCGPRSPSRGTDRDEAKDRVGNPPGQRHQVRTLESEFRMQFVGHLALVSESASVALADLTRVSAALQKQVTRDLSSQWDVQGTVDGFASLEDVPPGYWPIIIKDDIGQDAAGVHCDDTGQPMALVTSDLDWSVTASHEALEMLVDPFGNTRIAGQSVIPDQGRVEYLVEVSDPVSGKWYLVNGVKVADFYTRHFFDPVQAAGVQYSFMGNLTGPRQILSGGYLTWFEPVAGEWWQQSWFVGDQPAVRKIGPVQKTTCGMRPTIDRLTARHRREVAGKPIQPETPDAERAARAVAASSKAKAARWRAHIDKIAGQA